MKQPHFLHVDTNSQSCSKSFWLGIVKIWMWPILSLEFKLTVYLKNEQMKLPDFLHAGINSHKLKDNWKFLGWTW